MKKETMKNIFIEGPISATFIAESIQHHNHKTNIGAHSIFLGQVRADKMNDQIVCALHYTTYEEMALEKMHSIR
jgi:molybdopterin synthase catalytic subunit